MPLTVADIMKERSATVDDTALMGFVEAEMRIADVRHVIVVDDRGRLAGIVSRGDLMRALEQGARGPVKDFMTRRVYTVRTTDPAVKAVDLMIQHNIGAIPVLDDDERPVGVVRESDVLGRARDSLARV